MRVHLFAPPTVGTRDELRDGMAGQHADLYRRTLDDIARVARFAADTPAQHVHVGATRSDETEMDAVTIGRRSRRRSELFAERVLLRLR